MGAITVAVAIVCSAGREAQAKCFLTGGENFYLTQAAKTHAIWCARHHRLGHQNWDSRKAYLFRKLSFGGLRDSGIKSIEEVAASSWPGQSKADAAKELFNAWKQSKGHWRAINRPCKIYGFAMARGTDGVWYGIGIVGR